jgi:uncharacterized membrane protein YfcA
VSEIILFFFVFLSIALVYSSVGFGGGSSYLAVLALSGLPFGEVRLTAMACNIAVVLGNTTLFRRSGWWDGRKYLPFVAAGMPMAFLGALIPLREQYFFILLGGTLLLAALLLWFQPGAKQEPPEEAAGKNRTTDWISGGSIGLLSGMVGTGGTRRNTLLLRQACISWPILWPDWPVSWFPASATLILCGCLS